MANKTQSFSQSDVEIAQLIQEVRAEVATLLKSEAAPLAKGETTTPESSAAETSMAKDEFPPEASAGSASQPSAPPDAGSASLSGSPSESSSSSSDSSSGSSSGSSGSDDGAGPEQLQQAYEQLSPEEQLMHLQALKAAIMKHGGGDPASAAPMGAPPMAAPGPDATMPGEGSQPVAPAFKSEAQDKEIESLKKRAVDAEAKVKEMTPEIEDLQKSVGVLTDAFEKMLKKPQQKALTAAKMIPEVVAPVADVSKLSKSEVTKRLIEVTRRPDLKKSDRELINSFYNGKAQVQDLAHFFK